MRYRSVIFDFDGTLADSPWFFDVMNEAAGRYGFRAVTPEELPTVRRMGNRQLLAHLGVRRWKLPWIARFMRKRAAARIDETRLFEGIPDALRALAASGAVISIVSSNSEANIRRVLGSELSGLIRHYECGMSFFGKKRGLLRTARATRIEARDAIYIGDEPRDIEAARQAGMAAAGVAWGFFDRVALEALQPDLLLESPVELGTRL